MAKTKPNDIDEYIAGFPKEVQKILEQIRSTIQKAVPKGEENISYGIPSFNLNGKYLIYFAAHKKHIGVYPVPTGRKEFEKDFAPYYTSGKGTIQFPLDKPIPYKSIAKIAKFRAKQNIEQTRKKPKS